ncbi:MAG: hypothetical protein Q8N93_06920, partial [Bacillota bacterium]|nr:hypothetical protein [Bacillota bacterium]
SALESPFGGVIKISGTITHAPNNPAEADKLKYKVQYKKSTEAIWHDIEDKFRIWIRIDGVPSGYLDQEAIGGYFKYQKDLQAPTTVEVEGDVIAQWHTPVSGGDGLYEIRVLLYKLGAPPVPGVPADHISSNTVKVRVDNTRPDAEIFLDAGPCEFTTPGAEITGKFKATDQHFWRYRLTVLPYPPSTNDKFKHRPLPALEYIYGEEPAYPTLPASGVTNGTFGLDTLGMKPCGYVVYLYVWDRTIVNNHMQGNQKPASVGFCLLEEK